MPYYHRLAHMKETPLVKIGDWVKRGQPIGYVGSTGASNGAHCHYDILNMQSGGSFTQYVYGMALAWVRSRYVNPNLFIKENIPVANTLPLAGYSFLEYVKSGNYYHPGCDVNSLNDFGKVILSPVEGRVVYVLGTTWIKNLLGKIIGSKNYNSGWGNMVVIEQSPNFKL